MEGLSKQKKAGLWILGLGVAGAAIWYASSEAQAAELPDGNAEPLPPDYPSGATPAYSSVPSDQTSSYDPYAVAPGQTNYPTTPQQLAPATTSPYTSRGNATIQLYQQRLADLGYDPGPIDGLSGSFTRRAVMDFQRDNSLTVDGILGPRTKAAIDGQTGTPAPTSGIMGRTRRYWNAGASPSKRRATPTSGLANGNRRRWRA